MRYKITIIDAQEVSYDKDAAFQIAQDKADRTGCPVEISAWRQTSTDDLSQGKWQTITTLQPKVRKRPLV